MSKIKVTSNKGINPTEETALAGTYWEEVDGEVWILSKFNNKYILVSVAPPRADRTESGGRMYSDEKDTPFEAFGRDLGDFIKFTGTIEIS